MYLHLGQNTVVSFQSILGIFDLDNTTGSHLTRQFLKESEQGGRVVSISEELPKSFVLCMERGKSTIYLSQLSPITLLKRAESHFIDGSWSDQAREDIHGRAI
ncbi:MAG: extracellular matrix regulator RemB [Oscillospiraceae bacterium]|jgi:hypothetical protein